MTVEHVRAVLAEHRDELDAMGVASLELFGSVARGEGRPDSDLDFLVTLSRTMGLFEFAGIERQLADWFGCEVDLGTARGLRPYLRERVLAEAVHAYGRLAPAGAGHP